MYQTLKNIISNIIPRKFLFEQEENFRRLYAVFYIGNQFQCNICKINLKKFIALSNGDSMCPKCGSLQRNRRLWQLLETEFLTPNSTLLDFSPSRCLYRKLKKTPNINYQSTDLSGDFIADFQFDITNLKIADNCYDLIICYHILEHIPDDIAAMKELYRVMKPGAKALVQTPFKEGEIYENYNIISEEERLLHFGQKDHLRIYSDIGLKKRLESCGFQVEIREAFDDENKLNLNAKEKILILTKPLNS